MHPTLHILFATFTNYLHSARSMCRPDERLLPKRKQGPNMDMSEPDDAESELVNIVLVQLVDSDIGAREL